MDALRFGTIFVVFAAGFLALVSWAAADGCRGHGLAPDRMFLPRVCIASGEH